MISVIGRESSPAFSRSSAYAVSTASTALASPNSPMKNSGCDLLSHVDPVEDRADLVCRVVGVSADLELDERRALVRRDLARVLRVERRAHVLHHF